MNPRTGIAVALLLPLAVALTACNGGAQNIDPAGKQPGASANRTNAAQENMVPCVLLSDSALQTLTKASSKGPARVGYGFKGGDVWYISAPLGASTYTPVVGLFATTSDPSDQAFDSKIYALNTDARKDTSLTPAPSKYDANSSAAKKAQKCKKDAGKS